MKPILFFLAMFALLTLGLTCCSHAADTSPPPLVVDWTLDAAPPVLLAACPAGQCAAPALSRGQPLRNTARIAAAPLRRLAAVRPLRRVGAAIREAQPLRRAGRLALAPIRWLRR
jgi:hypothetical protein